MKPAALYRLAKAAAVTDKPSLIITAAHGRVYAAWGCGCILLPDPIIDWLGVPDPGTYTITSRGELAGVTIPGHVPDAPAVIRDRMLPLLDRTDRTPVQASGWLHEHGVLLRRYLTRPGSREPLAVHDDLWRAWNACTAGDTYATPYSRDAHAILWAPTPDAQATALLLDIPARHLPTPPNWTPEGP
jgi:hypothetical protein